MASDTEKVGYYGTMAHFSKEFGKMIKQMVLEN